MVDEDKSETVVSFLRENLQTCIKIIEICHQQTQPTKGGDFCSKCWKISMRTLSLLLSFFRSILFCCRQNKAILIKIFTSFCGEKIESIFNGVTLCIKFFMELLPDINDVYQYALVLEIITFLCCISEEEVIAEMRLNLLFEKSLKMFFLSTFAPAMKGIEINSNNFAINFYRPEEDSQVFISVNERKFRLNYSLPFEENFIKFCIFSCF